ncbi:unnamed protein product [Adineta ricciae]|uniref:FLYWCH-type domain-containing protein n=1 Tax=Adineta ricciae TaxID=249248 RepID=A0A816D5M7_ADIRI|nr:unnamed protein product [Adineta ricciae]CAF1633837.1 unnamed protein product [Adineta ricciae]
MTTASSSSSIAEESSIIIPIVLSQKGKPMIELNKYLFKSNKEGETSKYWICTFNDCSTKIHTNLNNDFIRQITEHCHPAEEDKTVREFCECVKQRAILETIPIPRIYDEECEKILLSLAAISILASEREMSSAINKARHRGTPIIPTTHMFEIPDVFTQTLRENAF